MSQQGPAFFYTPPGYVVVQYCPCGHVGNRRVEGGLTVSSNKNCRIALIITSKESSWWMSLLRLSLVMFKVRFLECGQGKVGRRAFGALPSKVSGMFKDCNVLSGRQREVWLVIKWSEIDKMYVQRNVITPKKEVKVKVKNKYRVIMTGQDADISVINMNGGVPVFCH